MFLLHDFIFLFIPCFLGLVLEKMEHRKNVVKNRGMSRPYSGLSIEGVLNFYTICYEHEPNLTSIA